MNERLKSQAGITLLEVLLAIILGTIVVGMAVNFFIQGQMTYTKAQDKTDAQSQLRIAMNNIKKELSVAIDDEETNTYTEISGTPGSFEAGFLYFYVDNEAIVLNAPVLDSGTVVSKIQQVCQPLPGLDVTFSISPHDTNNKMLRVKMVTGEGAEMYSDILLQNIISGIRGSEEGTVLKFSRIN